jgi:hypothetical protein
MVSLAIGVTCQLLLAVMLALAIKRSFTSKYRVLYSVVAVLFLVGTARFIAIQSGNARLYLYVYWYTQFLIASGFYAVLWQVYESTLRSYPGAAKAARAMVSSAFLAVCIYSVSVLQMEGANELAASVLQFEINLHVVQILLVGAFIWIIRFYEIPLGRNLSGVLAGHILFVVSRVVVLYVQGQVRIPFNSWRMFLEPFALLATFAIWCVALRSYRPNPVPAQLVMLESDYELLRKNSAWALSRAKRLAVRLLHSGENR